MSTKPAVASDADDAEATRRVDAILNAAAALIVDPFNGIPYWTGAYPKHPATAQWWEKAIYSIIHAGLLVGSAKSFPLKQVFVVLSRKHLFILKASDLTLCRRISTETVRCVYSNAGPSSPSPAVASNQHRDSAFGGFDALSKASQQPFYSPTAFVILKGSTGSTATSVSSRHTATVGGRKGSSIRGVGEDASWQGDIAIQGSRSEIAPFLEVFMKLLAYTRNIASDATFGSVAATRPGEMLVELSRAETSLLDTKVEVKPVPSTRDDSLAYVPLDSLFLPKMAILEKFCSDVRNKKLRDHDTLELLCQVRKLKSPQELEREAEAAQRRAEEERKFPPPSAALRQMLATEPMPDDLLAYVEPAEANRFASQLGLYRPLTHVAALWAGLIAIDVAHSIPAPTVTDAAGDAGPKSTLLAVAFITRTTMYIACNEFDIASCVPLTCIREVLMREKRPSMRRKSSTTQQTSPTSDFPEIAQLSPSSPTSAGSQLAAAAPRCCAAVLFEHWTSPALNQPLLERKHLIDASDLQSGLDESSSAASPSKWSKESACVSFEFETQASASLFVSVIRSLRPDKQSLRLSLWSNASQLEDAMAAASSMSKGAAPSGIDQEPLMRNPLFVHRFCPLWRRSTSTEAIAFRLRLFAFYEAHRPSKLHLVDRVVILRLSEGADDVLSVLATKYGPEPDTSLQVLLSLLVETGESVAAMSQPTPPPTSRSSPVKGVIDVGDVTDAVSNGSITSGAFEILPPPAARRVAADEAAVSETTGAGFGGSRARNVSFVIEPAAARGIGSVESNASFSRGDSMRTVMGAGNITEKDLVKHNAPPPTAADRVADALGAPRSFGSQLQLQTISNSRSLSVDDHISILTNATSPVQGATIGDVLRSFGFSTTYFDRFSVMYFPPHLGIASSSTNPDHVQTFEKLLRAFAPDEDRFYAALIARAKPSAATAALPPASPQLAQAVSGTTSSPSSAGRVGVTSANATLEFVPASPESRFVDPSTAWGRYQVHSPDASYAQRYQPPEVFSVQQRNMRYATMDKSAGYATPTSGGRGALERWGIASEDLRAMVVEPLSSSISSKGPDDRALTTGYMSPPVFSGRRPEHLAPTSFSRR